MSFEQVPLIFFSPAPGSDPLLVAQGLSSGSAPDGASALDTPALLGRLKDKRGFGRLKFRPPDFSLDNPRREVGLEGTAHKTHIEVRFSGNFEVLAAPLFEALKAEGLVCYSVWDKSLLDAWPVPPEPETDGGFAARMMKVMERESARLRETEPDPRRRIAILNAFIKGPEFRAQMAKEAREEPAQPRGKKKTYSDLVDCYARWKSGTPSAVELREVRKLVPKYAEMGFTQLRTLIGNSPHLIMLTASTPARAKKLRNSAAARGLEIEIQSAAG